ncbi:class I glutamine amidotransferase-like protein [Polyplosphaeria fusca]|uniref:D-lactate dehydratase n=1 Tax=Polyplosphaeria fusca TaxID=682080 RepID=A0A9P4R0B1_9PLEO|nr:class I glutamine amidotransferase-like protein [Polyplosphaeria fusca]
MPLPKRVLIAVTSASADLFPSKDGKSGEITGVFIGEALHPFNVFKKAGFEVDIASEEGHYTPDWLSLQPGFLSDEERKQYEDVESEFRSKLDAGVKAKDVDGGKYGVFFASAGHASLIDYPHAKALKKIGMTVWDNGGIVSSVCHGPAIFPDMLDGKTGEPIIKGKKITGFTTQAEVEMKVLETLRTWKEPLVDETAEQLGATYERSAGVWDDFHIVDGRLITGQNPQSATSTAEAVVEAFGKL